MDIEVTDNSAEHRYEIRVDGKLAGFTAYRERPGRLEFTHTEIGDEFEGQGLGSKLIGTTLDDVRSRGDAVIPICPFMKAYIERHPEYVDLVPESERVRFGL
jgi:predicted GNAT family acetyltransferase